MKGFLVFLVCIASVVTLPWKSNVVQERVEEYVKVDEKVIRSYYKNDVPLYVPEDKKLHKVHLQHTNHTLLGFSWSNCAKASDLTINKLTISPDPIVVPGTVTVGLDATIATQITQITSAVLVVKKKLFGVFIEVPCVDNFGSCTYNNICPMLANITCPQQLIDMGFTCQCPFAAKDYEVPDDTKLKIPKLPIPSSIENGEYDIKVTLMNGSTTLACYEFKATLKSDGYAIVV